MSFGGSNMKLVQYFTIALLVPAAAQAAVGKLTLEEYLGQVKKQHGGVRGAQETSTGAEMRAAEGSLLLSPTASLSGNWLNTKNPATTSGADKLVVSGLSLGLTQLTTFGLSANLSYGLKYNNISGSPMAPLASALAAAFPSQATAFSALGASQNYYYSGPTLSLTQSFWRNAFGREIKATQNLLRAQAMATHYGESYKVRVALAEAENTYWRMALAQENVRITKDNLERAEKLREWNARRSRLQLADKADLLQAEAAYRGRQLEYQNANDEAKSAARAFNTARGIDIDIVDEALDNLESSSVMEIQMPVRDKLRDDVKAAEQLELVTMSNAIINREKNKPSFDLKAAVSLTGRDSNLSSSLSNSIGTGMPEASVALTLTTPLEFGKQATVREGYSKEGRGAELSYDRKLFEQEREWNDLVSKFNDAKKRVEMTQAIEEAQREKLMYERDRLNRGRTTTFQVLTFEQDYASAQLNNLRAKTEVLGLAAKMKTFGGAQ